MFVLTGLSVFLAPVLQVSIQISHIPTFSVASLVFFDIYSLTSILFTSVHPHAGPLWSVPLHGSGITEWHPGMPHNLLTYDSERRGGTFVLKKKVLTQSSNKTCSVTVDMRRKSKRLHIHFETLKVLGFKSTQRMHSGFSCDFSPKMAKFSQIQSFYIKYFHSILSFRVQIKSKI